MSIVNGFRTSTGARNDEIVDSDDGITFLSSFYNVISGLYMKITV